MAILTLAIVFIVLYDHFIVGASKLWVNRQHIITPTWKYKEKLARSTGSEVKNAKSTL